MDFLDVIPAVCTGLNTSVFRPVVFYVVSLFFSYQKDQALNSCRGTCLQYMVLRMAWHMCRQLGAVSLAAPSGRSSGTWFGW